LEKSYAIAITQIYPQLSPNKDFVVLMENGNQFIKEWNASEPKPTVAQLENAWNVYLGNNTSSSLTPIQELQKQQTDLIFELMLKGAL
jgi:hypothetical protein